MTPPFNSISTEEQLDDALTTPRPVLVDFMRNISSPLVILGAGGKMGPTLAVLARRAAEAASHSLEIIAVSRFNNVESRSWLEARGVKTIQADLLKAGDVEKLPNSENVLYLAGMKFGTQQNPSQTWAVNTLAPAHAAVRYRSARIVALSTGNVYPMVPVESGGATETASLTPLGEYANAAVARERILEYFSRENKTAMALLRLNYAIEFRYGVLVDIGRNVWAGEAIDLSNGYFNCIWQGDANERIIRALSLCRKPAKAWNLTGEGRIEVRAVAEKFAGLFGRAAKYSGSEAKTALLSNSSQIGKELGAPETSVDAMIEGIAAWIKAGGRFLNKPTHFEVRDGGY